MAGYTLNKALHISLVNETVRVMEIINQIKVVGYLKEMIWVPSIEMFKRQNV